MILLSLGFLTSQYLISALFDYYLFYAFAAGLLSYCALRVLRISMNDDSFCIVRAQKRADGLAATF
jgi:hypothetical protein